MTDDPYRKWPHLENLDRVPQVLQAESLWVTEKVDGFNARIGRTAEGEPWFGTRNEVGTSAGNAAYAAFAAELGPRLAPGETLYGEWAGKGIQKRIDYGPQAFWLFGVDLAGVPGGPVDVVSAASLYGLKVVPTLYLGKPTLEELDAYRTAESAIAPGQLSEGVVVSPWPPMENGHGGRLIAKYKNPAFEERASQRRPDRPIVDLSTVEAFVAEYATEERLTHVLAQVAESVDESWTDPLQPRWTGDVLRAMYADIVREGADDYAALSEGDQKLVGKVSARLTKALLDAARAAELQEVAA